MSARTDENLIKKKMQRVFLGQLKFSPAGCHAGHNPRNVPHRCQDHQRSLALCWRTLRMKKLNLNIIFVKHRKRDREGDPRGTMTEGKQNTCQNKETESHGREYKCVKKTRINWDTPENKVYMDHVVTSWLHCTDCRKKTCVWSEMRSCEHSPKGHVFDWLVLFVRLIY